MLIKAVKNNKSTKKNILSVEYDKNKFELRANSIFVKPKSSPKSKSQIQVPNLKSKVKRKGTGTWADTIILQATHPNPRLDPID